jgi:hypothetical protein
MSILGSLLGGSGGGGGTAAGSGAGGATSQGGNTVGPNIITVNANSPQSNPAGSAIQNAGSILAILNQGSAQNGAVNYNSGPYFQALNPLPSENPFTPASLVGPAPNTGPNLMPILLIGGFALLAFFIFRNQL